MKSDQQNFSDYHLCINNLTLVRDEHRLVDNFSMQLKPADFIQIKGPNGSGKTTMMRAICGLHTQESGEINYLKAGQESHPELLYIGHEPALKADLTALENLKFYSSLFGYKGELLSILEELRLAEHQNKLVRHLSSGQKRRVALARLKMSQAPIWVLDEPLVAIDTDTIKWLIETMESHLKVGGSILITSHQAIPSNVSPVIVDLSQQSEVANHVE